jgi:hypothetical protein
LEEKKSSLIGILVTAGGLLVVLIAWLISTLLGASSPQATITNFEQCKADPDSVLQESFPETCVTVDGRRFTGPTN